MGWRHEEKREMFRTRNAPRTPQTALWILTTALAVLATAPARAQTEPAPADPAPSLRCVAGHEVHLLAGVAPDAPLRTRPGGLVCRVVPPTPAEPAPAAPLAPEPEATNPDPEAPDPEPAPERLASARPAPGAPIA